MKQILEEIKKFILVKKYIKIEDVILKMVLVMDSVRVMKILMINLLYNGGLSIINSNQYFCLLIWCPSSVK